MKLVCLLGAFAVAIAMPGCGEEDTEPSIPSEGTIFEYSRAGGLAFSIYEVAIDADGTGIARFGGDPENLDEREFALTDEELNELRSILEDAPLSELPDPGETVCSDCFAYSYAYGGDEYAPDDASDPVPELDDLRAFLSELPLPEDQPNGG